MKFFEYVLNNSAQIWGLTLDHIELTAIAVGFAILFGVPLGILISYIKPLKRYVLGVANVIQAIPSMAMLGLMIPLLGIGEVPAVVAVILYSLLPIIKNTVTGIASINPNTLEAAHGIGFTRMQVLTRVQIPIALPIIMAGVRISAVTAVGLMTMAAFIGAGGLGYLVFAGIRTANNAQILAGAIPAALLALAVDFLLSILERLVTPLGLQPIRDRQSKKARRFQAIFLIFVVGFLAFTVAYPSISKGFSEKSQPTVLHVGSKDFTENIVLSYLFSDAIEDNTDIDVVTDDSLGGTQVALGALDAHDIDMYVDYTGTIYSDVLGYEPISDSDEMYATISEEFPLSHDAQCLQPMSFNNTYALAVTKETAEAYGLSTISDLSKVADELTIGATYEFMNRDDGLPGLQKKYGFEFGSAKAIDSSPRYTALAENEVQVISAFATDGLLKKYDLVTLEDDQGFFPAYYGMVIIDSAVYNDSPELQAVFDKLGDTLTSEVMTQLNYEVDVNERRPADVAREYLTEIGMLDTSGTDEDTVMHVGSKDFTENIVLSYLFSDAIEENTDIDVVTNDSLGGTQIALGALDAHDIDMYVDYTGTIYSDVLGHEPISDSDEMFATISEEFPLNRDAQCLEPMGFNNTYTLAVTKETADAYGLTTISDLSKVADKLTIGATYEFMNRDDGLPGLQKKYGFEFGSAKAIDSSPRYTALAEGDVQVISAFATDGLLEKYDLVTLEDDQGFFPAYYGMVVIDSEVYNNNPELQVVFDELGDTLTSEVMTKLNYEVDVNERRPAEVAKEYLTEIGMMKE